MIILSNQFSQIMHLLMRKKGYKKVIRIYIILQKIKFYHKFDTSLMVVEILHERKID